MKPRHFIDIGLIITDGIWMNEDAFAKEFSLFLKSRGLIAVQIKAQNKIILEIGKGAEPVTNVPDEPIKEFKPTSPRQSINALMQHLTSVPQEKKLKIFKETIL